MSERRVIGFDREIRLEWLDAVASRAAAGNTPAQTRQWLDGHLADALGGIGRSGHRGKTVTVLTRIWVNVPTHCVPLRNRAVKLLSSGDASDRLALHWAMASAVYPFFRDVTGVVGRLLTLQGSVERQAVLRRVIESWGDRPAVSRGCRAVWTSITSWGALSEGGRRGLYSRPVHPISVSVDTTALLAKASVPGGQICDLAAPSVVSNFSLFPFVAASSNCPPGRVSGALVGVAT